MPDLTVDPETPEVNECPLCGATDGKGTVEVFRGEDFRTTNCPECNPDFVRESYKTACEAGLCDHEYC